MPRSPEDQKEWEQQCYGCSQAALDEMANQLIGSPVILVMGILSDAQEVHSFDPQSDRVRQFMNRAKYLMQKLLVPKEGEPEPFMKTEIEGFTTAETEEGQKQQRAIHTAYAAMCKSLGHEEAMNSSMDEGPMLLHHVAFDCACVAQAMCKHWVHAEEMERKDGQ